jgi:hypothetical protein
MPCTLGSGQWSGSPAGWWTSTAAPSTTGASSSTWRRPSCGVACERSRLRCDAHQLGQVDGLPPVEAGTTCRRLGAAPLYRAPPSGLGHGLPIRGHRQWSAPQIPQHRAVCHSGSAAPNRIQRSQIAFGTPREYDLGGSSLFSCRMTMTTHSHNA